MDYQKMNLIRKSKLGTLQIASKIGITLKNQFNVEIINSTHVDITFYCKVKMLTKY